jgi:hypothetical protein
MIDIRWLKKNGEGKNKRDAVARYRFPYGRS